MRTALTAIERHDWDVLKHVLHPYVRWTVDGTTTRGRVNVLTGLAEHPVPTPPTSVELRDGQIYRWTVVTPNGPPE